MCDGELDSSLKRLRLSARLKASDPTVGIEGGGRFSECSLT